MRKGYSRCSIQVRCSPLDAIERRRTSGQRTDWPGCGFSQLRIQAFHASCRASPENPGSSDQRAGTQRLLPRVKAGGKGASSAGPSGGSAAVRGGAAGSGGRTAEPQAASIPTITAEVRTRNMLLILLEALGALVLLLLIVWWTMFSGRKGGEPPGDDEKKP